MEIWATDLKDMYHSFIIGESRARTNCVAMTFTPQELYFAADLPMGDGSAVDFAPQAHTEVLHTAGLFPENCR
eukprot:5754576-Amphidinium_carterae.1